MTARFGVLLGVVFALGMGIGIGFAVGRAVAPIEATSPRPVGPTSIRPAVEVPSIIGLRADEAANVVRDAGLCVGDITWEVDTAVPPGTVVGQEPAATTSVAPVTVVAVRMAVSKESESPRTVVMTGGQWAEVRTAPDAGSSAAPHDVGSDQERPSVASRLSTSAKLTRLFPAWITVCSCGWESKAFPRRYDSLGPFREHVAAATQEPTRELPVR